MKIAKGCVCSHYYLISSEGDGANPPNSMVDREAEDGEVVPGQWRELLRGKAVQDVGQLGSNAYTRFAKSVRDQFKSYFVSPDGQVAWQENIVFGLKVLCAIVTWHSK